MDMQTRLVGLRDRIQVNHRLNFKAKMLSERRKRILEHLPPVNHSDIDWWQLLSEESVRAMLHADDINSISKLFRAPCDLSNLLRNHSREFLSLARKSLIGDHRIQAMCIIGNIATTEFFDSKIIDQTAVLELVELFSETSAPEELKVFFCVFRDLYRHVTNPDIFSRLCQQYERVEQALQDIPIELLEMINEFKAPELQPNESFVRRMMVERFREGQSTDLLMEIIQIVERQLQPLPHHEQSLSPYHHSQHHVSNHFHYYVVEFVLGGLGANFPQQIKAQLIELIGVVVSSSCKGNGDMIDYLLGHKIVDELLLRSKIDLHLCKLASISSLSTLLVYCRETRQIEVLAQKAIHDMLVKSLQYNEPEVLLKVLKGLAKLLVNDFKPRLVRLSVEEYLERLQKHSNCAVHRLTEVLIQEFFQEEFC